MMSNVKKLFKTCSRFYYGTSKYDKGYFYIMQETDPFRKELLILKYGISVNNPELRRRQLQTCNPYLILLLGYWVVGDMGEVENMVKGLLYRNNIQRGSGGKEWVEIPRASVDNPTIFLECLTTMIGSKPESGTLSIPQSPKLIMGRGDLQKEGYIYIISDEGGPHGYTVKVGATERDPTERVSELQTGNSKRLILRAYARVTNMGEAEKLILQAMMGDNLRQDITGGTEWFKCESLQKLEKYLGLIKHLKTLQRSKSF